MASSAAITSLTGSVNVAIIGVGLVGSSVIAQITSSSTLQKSLSIVALQNSKKLLLSPSSSQLSSEQSWKSALQSSSESAKAPKELIPTLTKIQEQSKKHTVIIDNTSNDDVASAYPDFLKAGFSIVTPNKKAYSGSKQLFDNIISAISSGSSQKSPLIYLESTVGAGLPIISTLKDLIATGDEILKIEGVLSGTLSYIFNVWCPASLDSKDKFSDVVKVAKDNGYTEPYPGDDLSGSDVARKLTILSRLVPNISAAVPLAEGYASVNTRSLTPAALLEAEKRNEVKDGDDYIARLKAFDDELGAMREEAKKEGKVWRYVGVIDGEKKEVKASLEKYPVTHPFAASLGGSDNIISFTTKRYSQRPLLVQGSGAGADVTAMGVVADLIKVAERRGA